MSRVLLNLNCVGFESLEVLSCFASLLGCGSGPRNSSSDTKYGLLVNLYDLYRPRCTRWYQLLFTDPKSASRPCWHSVMTLNEKGAKTNETTEQLMNDLLDT